MDKILSDLLSRKVAIKDCETRAITSYSTVEEITEGSGLYIEVHNNNLCLFDGQTDELLEDLGNTVESALFKLNEYTECFNDISENEGSWESDFMLTEEGALEDESMYIPEMEIC